MSVIVISVYFDVSRIETKPTKKSSHSTTKIYQKGRF